MTTKLTRLGLAIFTLLSMLAFADQARVPNRFNYRGGVANARDYGTLKFQTTSSVTAVSSSTAVVPFGVGPNTQPGLSQSCIQSFGNGRNIQSFFAGQHILVIDGTLSETILLTAVTLNLNNNQCTITATFANAHGAGVTLQSGSFGLEEALFDVFFNSGVFNGAVAVDPDWQGTTAIISAVAPLSMGISNMYIYDTRGVAPQFWAVRPSAVTLIAAPAAPVPVAIAAGGSLSSGAYKATAAYVDCNNGISLDSAESAATATATAVSIPSPAASTGACGWLPRLSTAGGSANEILAASPLTSANCVLSVLTSFPSCQIGAAATVSAANPSSTAKPSVEANAFTTLTFQPFSHLPTPFVDSYTFGIFVATATINNSNADAAQFGPIQAGYFNFFAKKWKVCVKGATATQVASSILTVNIKLANEYAQSPVTVSALAFPTQTQAAAGTFEGCAIFQNAGTGASGKFWAATPEGPWVNFLSSAPATQVVTADASAAASSTLDLTKTIYGAINLTGTGGANITVPIINSLTLAPVE